MLKYVNVMYSFSPQVHCHETCQNSYKIVKSKITVLISLLSFSFTENLTQMQNNTSLSLKTFLTTSQKWLLLMICLQEVSPSGLLQNDQGDTLYPPTHLGSRIDKIYWTTGFRAEEKGRKKFFFLKKPSKIGTYTNV